MSRPTSIPCAPTSLAAALLVALAASAGPMSAQGDPFAQPPLHVLEVTTRSRWIHSAVPAASVPFQERRDRLHLRYRPARRSSGASLTFDRGGPEGRLVVDERNIPMLLDVVPARRGYGPARTPAFRGVEPRGMGRFGPDPSLVETRLFEVPVPLPSQTIVPGLTWSERTRIEAGIETVTESLDIEWRLTAEGDTTLADDRRLPIVRIEGEVAFRLVQRDADPTRSIPKFIEREGSGSIVGRIVLDTVRGIRAAGTDTVRLEGTSTLVMQDGRRFTEPASFERIRQFAAFDSAAWDAEQERRTSERRRTRGGMVSPATPESDDAPLPQATVDPLWGAWAAAEDDLVGRESLEGRLWANQGGGRNVFLDTLAARRLASGDSTMVFRHMPSMGPGGESLGAEEWATLAPFLHDPGRAWRWQLGPPASYVDLASLLLATSPHWDSSRRGTFCRPTDCDEILADMETSPEPRLREAAAVWRFARDPRAHWAEVLALRDEGSLVMEPAVAYGRGIGAQWPSATGLAMPDDGATWREWLEWMGGEVRFEASHRASLRFFEARTGRDPLGDLERRWTDLADDSARLIIGTILRSSDRMADPTPDEIVTDLLSGRPARIAAARRALGGRRAEADTLSPAAAAPFMRAVLDSMAAGGTSPWSSVADEGYVLRPGQAFHGAREVPVFVDDRLLDEALLDAHPFTAIDSTTWANRDQREGGVLVQFAPVQRAGDLLHIGWSWSAWFDRGPDETPEGYAGGEGVWLLRVDDEWRVALTSGWIT